MRLRFYFLKASHYLVWDLIKMPSICSGIFQKIILSKIKSLSFPGNVTHLDMVYFYTFDFLSFFQTIFFVRCCVQFNDHMF